MRAARSRRLDAHLAIRAILGGGRRGRLRHQSVHPLDEQKDGEGNDQKLDDGVQEAPVSYAAVLNLERWW